MKITLTCDNENEANGVLLALGKLPIEVAGGLYSRFQKQIVEQTKGAAAVLGVPNVPPAPPAPPPAPGRKPPKRASPPRRRK